MKLLISFQRSLPPDSHFLPILDDFPVGPFHCVVVLYAMGGSLKNYGLTTAALSDLRIKSIMAQLPSALALLHGRGNVHCDVKYENILLWDAPHWHFCTASISVSNPWTMNFFCSRRLIRVSELLIGRTVLLTFSLSVG
jgi:hypothetical protein